MKTKTIVYLALLLAIAVVLNYLESIPIDERWERLCFDLKNFGQSMDSFKLFAILSGRDFEKLIGKQE